VGRLRRQGDGAFALLATEHIVGRQPSCHLPLQPGFVSAVHALIRWNGEAWDVRDLGSTNGTYVDGRRIAVGSPVGLTAGATIAFGEPAEAWRLVDDRAPAPAAIPQDGGEPSFFASGAIAIPTAN
jgi:predicted component of type VI protein secretion system